MTLLHLSQMVAALLCLLPGVEQMIVTALISSIIGAIIGAVTASFLNFHFNRKRDQREMKRDVLRRILGYRWTLTKGNLHHNHHFFTALNEASVVFAGDRDVEREIDRFYRAIQGEFRAEQLFPLAVAMATSAEVSSEAWTEERFKTPFAPGSSISNK